MNRTAATVERILDAAIKRLNSEGLAHVSLRGIAEDAGMSHSNLVYHFEDKEALLLEIYSRMSAEWEGVVYPGGTVTLAHYLTLLKRISLFHQRYRFFYLDLIEIARSYPKVARAYRRTIEARFSEHDLLVADLVSQKILKKSGAPELYRDLFHSIWVMSTFWLQHQVILGKGHSALGQRDDVQHALMLIAPHLTKKGLRELAEISGP